MLSSRFFSRIASPARFRAFTGINAKPTLGFARTGVIVRFFSTDPKLFDKILIANRGEIACRVIKSARALGIKTVAIYSEPDVNSLHVRMADEAVCVGPAASSASYLNMSAIMDAIKSTGAQAVHPGYGFLSENSEFQGLLQSAGVKFIGPGTYAINSMGDKIASKKIAKDANVNVIPGFLGEIADHDELLKVSNEIGYPVMIKASAGGGGKGMRVAYSDAEAIEGFKLSKAEAKSSFGNDTIFVEKFIEDPRHIEIQVLCDSQGNGIWLNERECSIQRRNQKVIEEAPSVFLTPETRKEMGDQAVALAKAVNYESAGTVEFIVDKHRNFFFLEMNTRLQVEHPVTEYITGVDLVEQMIRVAAGHPLLMTQDDVQIQGWSVESRVYAEDALKDFLPSIGNLSVYREPDQSAGDVRVDTGVREGAAISIHYDPLISKLITHGATREEAVAKMRAALDTYVIRGVTSNINFLRALMDHPRFIAGDMTTKFIEEEFPDGFKGIELSDLDRDAIVCAAVVANAAKLRVQTSISTSEVFDVDAYEASQLDSLQVTLDNDVYIVNVLEHAVDLGGVDMEVYVNGRAKSVSSNYSIGCHVYTTTVDGKEYITQVVKDQEASFKSVIAYSGTNFDISVMTSRTAELYNHMPIASEADLSKMIVSPMPGAIFSVNVVPGDVVTPGMEVCVIEAMKMQNAIRSTAAATVKSVNVVPGDTVSADDVLIEFD